MVDTVRPASKASFDVIGTRPVRPDGLDKVIGRAQYGADIHLPGALIGRVLRSPHPHANIRSIDTSRAESLPGVKAVITGHDFPKSSDKIQDMGETAMTTRDLSHNVMAQGKALYRGHAVAAVAATNARIAEEALALIDVDYEPLPHVLNVDEAMRPDAPILHDHLRTQTLGGKSDAASNVAKISQTVLGDIEEGFAKADVIVERDFTTTMVHQGYIEPHACSASWNADGQLTIWTTTQGAFSAREQTGNVLQYPISKIKVIPTEIGGGFGGKIPIYLEPIAALLSRKAGRPVKVSMNRIEEFDASGPTSGTHIWMKIGANLNGRITAADARLVYEAGAFPGSPVGAGMQTMFAPYDLENVRIEGYDVVVNKPKTAAYRAPGSPAAAFAAESVLDELAQRLELDPIEFRLRNASKQGTRQATGAPFRFVIGNIDTLEAAAASEHYRSPLPVSEGHKARGRGVAGGFWFNAGLKSSCAVSVNADGTVSLVEGNPDIGGTRASLTMQLAETLGIAYEDVKAAVVDTDSVGYSDVTGGSRTTASTGIAVYEAGMDIRRQLIDRAATIWSVPAEEVRYEHGTLIGPNEDQRLTFKQIAAQLNRTGAPVVGRAAVSPRSPGGAFAVQIADVEVDMETGKVDVLRYTAVQDVGRAVHPSYVEGQIQGGVAQGVGWALNEEYYYDDGGRLVNSSYLDYRMPTTLDLPMIETILVEVPHSEHPFGVRGVGEVPIVPPLAAVANAVSRALGHRYTDLPLSPRRLLETQLMPA